MVESKLYTFDYPHDYLGSCIINSLFSASFAFGTFQGPETMPRSDHVPWLLGGADMPLADWLSRQDYYPGVWGLEATQILSALPHFVFYSTPKTTLWEAKRWPTMMPWTWGRNPSLWHLKGHVWPVCFISTHCEEWNHSQSMGKLSPHNHISLMITFKSIYCIYHQLWMLPLASNPNGSLIHLKWWTRVVACSTNQRSLYIFTFYTFFLKTLLNHPPLIWTESCFNFHLDYGSRGFIMFQPSFLFMLIFWKNTRGGTK